jgi:radical SAM superfamily enzyme YgiQ (UPF0313 family)
MDVLFINPSSSLKAYQGLAETGFSAIEPPTWSLLLAQSLRSVGKSVDILDCDALGLSLEQSVSEIKAAKPRLACFVLYGQNPNAGTTSMIGGTALAKALKEEAGDEIKICFIGSHTSALPMDVLALNFVDFIIYNEGVYSLRELLETNFKDELDKVSGLGYKDAHGFGVLNPHAKIVPQDRMDIDLPGYAWDLLPKNKSPLDKYRAHFWHTNFLEEDRSPFAAIYSSLGCQFSCNFCMINIVNRSDSNLSGAAADYRGMRFWSPELILRELETLAGFGVKTLRISDEMFFLNKKYYVPILEGIIARGLKFNMWAYARIDSIRADQLDLFKRAGINWLCLGIEAGNQVVRMDVDKGRFQDVNIRDIVKTVQSHGIKVLGNYIFGFPEDNLDTMQQTLDLALELNTEHANFYPCQALPGSPLYFYAQKQGWDLPKRFEEFAFLSYECKPLPTKYLSAKEVLKFRDAAWQQYFSSPNFLTMVEKKFGVEAKDNVNALAAVSLRRELLGN